MGLSVETYAVHTQGELADMSTYRLYLNTASANDFLSIVEVASFSINHDQFFRVMVQQLVQRIMEHQRHQP